MFIFVVKCTILLHIYIYLTRSCIIKKVKQKEILV